ncbi:hypothetical protein ACS0TY_007404 [Phlomoides rotata]
MLEVTSASSEIELNIDFAEIYSKSSLHENNKEVVKNLSKAPSGSTYVHFAMRYAQNGWGSVLWYKQLLFTSVVREHIAKCCLPRKICWNAFTFTAITYPMIEYYWSAYKVLWYLYISYDFELYLRHGVSIKIPARARVSMEWNEGPAT